MKPHFRVLIALAILLNAPLQAQESTTSEAYRNGDALYQHGRGSTTDFPQALEHFLVAAEAGHPSAQFYAGRMYQLGHGTAANGYQAAKWYRLAGENGQARAWNNLGNLNLYGPDLPKNVEAALSCYGKASDMGMAMGSDNLAKIYHHGKHGIERDFAKAREYYTRAGQQHSDYPGIWNNLGRLYEQGGHGIERNLRLAKHAYEKAVAHDDADALYNLADLYYDKEFEAEPQTILDLLERAADLGHAKAQFRLGWIYESGRYGTRATHKALHYYELASEQAHAMALNNLAILLTESRRERANSPRVLELLEKAAALDNTYALNNLGYRHLHQKFDGADPRTGVELLIRSAELGHHEAVRNLGFAAHLDRLKPFLNQAEIERWGHAELDLKKQGQAAADEALEEAVPFIERQEYSSALAILSDRYTDYRWQTQKDLSSFLERIWWDAQTQRGRTDPEWGWRLFDWARNKYDEDQYHRFQARLTVRGNQIAGLVEVGRLGLVREICDELRQLLLDTYGLTLDSPTAALITPDGTPTSDLRFDLRVTSEMVARSKWNMAVGSFIANSAAHQLVCLGRERLYSGDWRDAFYFAAWAEAWALEVLESGKTPFNEPRGWVEETLHDARLLRARTHELLGNRTAAIEIYEEIIGDGRTPYQGRLTHSAILEAATLRARAGSANTVSISELETLETLQRANHYDYGEAAMENQLTRAWVHHAQGDPLAARQLLRAVLTHTETHERPFLRLNALIAAVEFDLAVNQLTGNESRLVEALELARSRGLRNIEPELYLLYARFLAAAQRVDEAIIMQTKAIESMSSLDLRPRLPGAKQTLARYFESTSSIDDADLSLTSASETGTKASTPNRPTDQSSVPPEHEGVPQSTASFDLQPESITFAPLAGREGEAIFTLSNLNAHTVQLALQFDSPRGYRIQPQADGRYLVQLQGATAAPGAPHAMTTLAPYEQILLRVCIPPDLIGESSARFGLSAVLDAERDAAELTVLAGSDGERVHLVNASEIIDNPFYLIPVFHQFSNPSDQSATAAIRAISSRPTRIEAYDELGQLIFVDAQGNGRFEDPGDLLASERVSGGFPVVEVDLSRQIEFRYQTAHSADGQSVEIEIQLRPTTESAWQTDVIDWLSFAP